MLSHLFNKFHSDRVKALWKYFCIPVITENNFLYSSSFSFKWLISMFLFFVNELKWLCWYIYLYSGHDLREAILHTREREDSSLNRAFKISKIEKWKFFSLIVESSRSTEWNIDSVTAKTWIEKNISFLFYLHVSILIYLFFFLHTFRFSFGPHFACEEHRSSVQNRFCFAWSDISLNAKHNIYLRTNFFRCDKNLTFE